MALDSVLVDAEAVASAGCFLRLASDGLLYLCQTSAASGVDADAITHFALTDIAAHADDTTHIKVGVVNENDQWEINERQSAVSEAKSGQQYGMYVNSTTDCWLDIANGTHVVFQVIRPVWAEREFQDASDDVKARVIVQVLYTTIHAAPAS